jgi:3,4-dihydroxy 2-butanone 4-phosphate synthase/GTP cyclohydrolase II
MKKNNFTPIENIINVAKKGGMFILVDDEKRENEGDLIISTTDSNAKNINFMAKYGRGLICLALDTLQAKRLNLSLMSANNQSRNKTAFAVSIEAKKGITTGISAKDRSKTIRVASKKNVKKSETISLFLTFFLEATLIVLDLSFAEIPVVIPFFASIDTAKAVLFLD